MVMNLSVIENASEMVIVICRIKSYLPPCTKVLCFVAFIVTSVVLGFGAAECYWGDLKPIKSGKGYAISSDVSEKQSIIYKSSCIE